MARAGHRPWAPILALALLGAGCATIDPSRTVLDELQIEGNETFSDTDIEASLALAETPDWPWADPQYFERGTLAGDRRRLLRFYRARGYYDAKVTSRVRKKGDEVDVTFVVREGPPTKVAKLELAGVDGLPKDAAAKLAPESLPLERGEPITEEAYDETRAELGKRLREAGYADAQVEGAVEVDVATRTATVVYRVTPGPRLEFGRVLVSGAVKIPRPTIIETVRDEIPEGARFDESKLAEVQRDLFDMGVFAGVRVSRGPTDPESGTVPVIVSLRESPFQTVRAGVGVGVEEERQEGRVTAEYTHRNFLGGLRRLTFENRFGYAFIPSVYAVATDVGSDGGSTDEPESGVKSGIVGTSTLEFTQPDLVRDLDLTTRLEYERSLEQAFRFDAVKGRLGFPIRLHRTLSLTPSFNLELYDVTGSTASTGRAELSAECNSRKFGSDVSEPCVLAFTEERLAWDLRDDPLRPTKGFYAALALQQGSGAFGSKFDYHRITAEQRAFFPMPWESVLALKVEGGLLLPAEGQVSPIMERFFGGGGSSIRSYGTNRLAPQTLRAPSCQLWDPTPDPDRPLGPTGEPAAPYALCVDLLNDPSRLQTTLDPAITVPIGGDALLEGSVELRVPIYGDLGLVLFTDAGNVSRRFDETGPSGETLLLRPNVAVGSGIRYHTLFGPVRLDFAYRVVNRQPTALATVTELVPDENGELRPVETRRLTQRYVAEDRFAFHFAIGEAF